MYDVLLTCETPNKLVFFWVVESLVVMVLSVLVFFSPGSINLNCDCIYIQIFPLEHMLRSKINSIQHSENNYAANLMKIIGGITSIIHAHSCIPSLRPFPTWHQRESHVIVTLKTTGEILCAVCFLPTNHGYNESHINRHCWLISFFYCAIMCLCLWWWWWWWLMHIRLAILLYDWIVVFLFCFGGYYHLTPFIWWIIF